MRSLSAVSVVGGLGLAVVLGLISCAGGETATLPVGQGAGPVGGTGGTGLGGAGGACSEELCDGVDNDCDQEVDEGCDCIDGDTQDCYSGDEQLIGVGTCAAGVQTCDEHGEWGECEGEVLPADEECDGLDNNCDTQVDDGFSTITCGLGACQVTVDECVGGQINPCVPGDPNPAGETCEGTDDDCDGQIDEGCNCTNNDTQPCYTGSAQTQNVGECHDGTQTCTNGQWGACLGDQTPQPELCDGLDNDCDGTEDDGDPEGGGVCATGVPGICAIGTYTCQNGDLNCIQNLSPVPEVCDGLDNNCNGSTDEGNPGGNQSCNTGQPGVCAAGTTQCQSPTLVCNPNTTASAEVCDGLDNDCDGSSDEGDPGGGASCNTGQQGVCNAGTQHCIAGWVQCQQNVQPSAEVCDLLDNNCDGDYDEGFYADTDNSPNDFPDVWWGPQEGSYETSNPTSGDVFGHLLPEGDHDWFSIYATEQKSDLIGDTPIKGQVTITSPGSGLWYEACACWSSTTVYCGKDDGSVVPTCVTSMNGNPATLTVYMDMTLGSTDTGYLDVEIRPDYDPWDYDCDDWQVDWTIWE